MEARGRRAGRGVAEVVADPCGEPPIRSRVVLQRVQPGDDVARIFRRQPLAVGEVAVGVDLGLRPDRPRHHQRTPRGESVVDHRGDVDDGEVGGGQLPGELARAIDDVLGRWILRVRPLEHGGDLPVRARVPGIDDARPRVRPVDHPMPPGRDEVAHQRHAVRRDGPVRGGRAVASHVGA